MTSLAPQIAFSQLGYKVFLVGGMVLALSRDEHDTIVVVERAYTLTVAAARGLLRVAEDVGQACKGSVIVTNVTKASAKASTAALQHMRAVLEKSLIYWAHFTLFSGYVRLHVFGEGYDSLLADEREEERAQALLAHKILGCIASTSDEETAEADHTRTEAQDIRKVRASVEEQNAVDGASLEGRLEWAHEDTDDMEMDSKGCQEKTESERGNGDMDHDQTAGEADGNDRSSGSNQDGGTKAAKRDQDDGSPDEDSCSRKRLKLVREGYDTADYTRDGRQFCVGIKSNGEPCGRSRCPLASPYFCCASHRNQYQASGLTMARI